MFSSIVHKIVPRPRVVHVLDCDRILVIRALNCARLCVVCALNCARILVVRALDCAQFLLHPALSQPSWNTGLSGCIALRHGDREAFLVRAVDASENPPPLELQLPNIVFPLDKHTPVDLHRDSDSADEGRVSDQMFGANVPLIIYPVDERVGSDIQLMLTFL